MSLGAVIGSFQAVMAEASTLRLRALELARIKPQTDQLAADTKVLCAAADVLERHALQNSELRKYGYELRKIEDKPALKGFE